MTTLVNTTKIKVRDTVELLKAQWIVDPKLGRQKIADEGIYEVEYVMENPDKLRLKSLLPYSKEGFWVPLEDVKLIESYVSPQEMITPVQGHVYRQFNGRPRGLWELVDILGQPSPIIKGALDGLERQGLIEEVELDVWRKVDVQPDTASDTGETEKDTSYTGKPSGDLSPCPSESDELGQTGIEETLPSTNGNRGAVPLSESAVVCGEEDQRPDWVIEAEEELNRIQGQIDNCALERAKAKGKDKQLEKACFEGWKENQKLFSETLRRYLDLAAEMNYSFSYQSQPPNSTENHLVVFAKPVEVCGEPRVAEPQSRLGEILNLAANSEAKVVNTPTLKEQEAEADRLWEMRSHLEGQLLHCLAQIYLGGEWRSNYKTWTQYFIHTFQHWQKTQRYRMKDAGELFAQFLQLSPQGENQILPTSEGQLRELKPLPPVKRVEVWEQIVQEHGGSPSRTVVAEVVKKAKIDLQQPAQLKAQVKTEEEIAAQFNCQVGDPVQVTYTGRSRGLESDITPQHDGLIGVVQHLGVASGLVYIPIMNLNVRCTPSQMVAVPLPSESRTICDRITALTTRLELTPMMIGALEALNRQVEYSEDDLWLLGQIEDRLTLLDPNQS